MKTILSIAMILASVTAAHADGFRCEGQNTGVKIALYNHTQAAVGTRTAAIMVISDPTVGTPNKTIAKFTGNDGTLTANGNGQYTAKVDLRYSNSNRAGENVGGTKLGQLKTIDLNVFFSYSNAAALRDASEIPARIVYNKRNGETSYEKATCKRYTKN